ncbi:peptidase inhibitor 16 isoform X1 [Dasypus novemcinctus]|uniref:peptidase inhibitor 16 isoform X1 n=1 Tax=Dasypus novemcinctus TaxID=9361 RepID=UPI0039C9C3DA
MRSLRGLLGLLLPWLLLPLAAPYPGITLGPEDKRTLLYLHNLYRQKPVPQAAYMLKMYWDEDLAVFAKGYAQNCTWAHNPQRGWRGENLFTSTGMELNLPLAVEEWFREIEFFNFSTNTCQPDQMCGHYTQAMLSVVAGDPQPVQTGSPPTLGRSADLTAKPCLGSSSSRVVWADSRLVGCGVHFCDFMHGIDERDMLMVVCNYQPPGNVRGRLPYKPGQPCSLCPPGTRCVDTLCEPITGPEEAQDLPSLVTEASSSLATEASAARKMGPPASPATGTPTFLPTDMPASLATQALPTLETEAPSSLATRGLPSMATDAPSSSRTDAPSFLTTANLLSPDEGPAPVPRSTPAPAPRATGRVASRTRAPSVRPEQFQPPEMSPTGAQKPLPHAQGKTQAGGSHKLPRSGELLASVSPAQDEPCELQATPVPGGHPSSRAHPSSPDASASTRAGSEHALALRSSRPDPQVPEEPGANLGIQPVVEPDFGPGAGTGAGTSAGTGAGTGLESGAGTNSGTGLESGAGTGLESGAGTGLESGAGTGIGPGTESAAGSDAETNLELGIGAGTQPDAGPDLGAGAGPGGQAGAVGNPGLEKPSKIKTPKGKPGKGKPGKLKAGSCPGPVWSALLGLLLPPLALAGAF